MKSLFTTCLVLSSLLWLPSIARPQSIDPSTAIRLQRTIDSMRSAHGIPGIGASVLLPGHDLWQGSSGGSHAGTPITRDMLFGIGSNSKLFTAAAALKCEENNRLGLDDSLYAWLPSYRNIDSNIAIRQLLNHTSGIADVNEIPGYPDSILSDPNRVFTREEVLSWVGPSHFPAGSSWEYSNTNYILAGMIVERAVGRPFAAFLRDSVLSPLQLDSSFLPIDEALTGIIAHPWANNADISAIPRASINSAAWCAGAMYSTSSEMAQWYAALMEGRVLRPESFREMTKFVGTGSYGFGISEKVLDGRLLWMHGGSIRGYTSQMLYDTTMHAVICVLTNETPAPAALIAQLLLGELVNGTVTSVVNEQPPDSAWQIYPNPATGIITIGNAQGPVRLYDALGRLMWTGMNADSLQIDTAGWPGGMYFFMANNSVKPFSKL